MLIGADHNALACAMHLSSKGWRVRAFEQAPLAGGAMKTGDYTLPGFRHDWAAINLSLFEGYPFFKAYRAEFAAKSAEIIPVARPLASAFPDGNWAGVSTDLAEMNAAIAALSPKDAETWAALLAEFSVQAESFFGFLGSPMRLRALASFMFKTLHKRGLAGTQDLAQFLLQPPRRFLTRTFESSKVQAMFRAWGMHLDFAPDVAGAWMFPHLEGIAGQAYGMAIGKGGADTIIRAMVAAIEVRRGRLETGISVTPILHRVDERRALNWPTDRE